jgi:uncharacterized membrane protein YhaH (DUF805 family)
MIFYIVMWFLFAGSLTTMAASGSEPSAGMLGAMGGGMIIFSLSWLALIVPTIAVQIRRMHDTNRSGWWVGAFYLLYLVYVVMLFGSMASALGSAAAGNEEAAQGATGMILGTGLLGILMFIYGIVLLVFLCLPGTVGPNKYGPDPYGAHENLEGVFS